jgi:hypothetical protein
LAAIIGSIVSLYFFVLRPQQQHGAWYREVELCILRLAERRPENLEESQWASCIHWTWNLHANYGPPSFFDATARDQFLSEFDRRLASEVDLATIDWIWDQYSLHSTGGRNYSKNYRPTTAERLREAAENRFDEFDLGRWIDELRRRDQ